MGAGGLAGRERGVCVVDGVVVVGPVAWEEAVVTRLNYQYARMTEPVLPTCSEVSPRGRPCTLEAGHGVDFSPWHAAIVVTPEGSANDVERWR